MDKENAVQPLTTTSPSSLSVQDIVMRMTAGPVASVESLCKKMTDAEQSELKKAYETKKNPRGVLQSVRNRLTDEELAKNKKE